MALAYTELPAAPETESSASTNGTPAAKVVARVREKRAIIELKTMSPITGSRSMILSITSENATDRFSPSLKAATPAAIPITATNHQSWAKLEIPSTNRVKAGSSEPKLSKVIAKVGTTLTSSMPVTISATTTTAIG